MSAVSEKDIVKITEKHLGFTLMLALVPIVFLFVIGIYEEDARALIPIISPISTIAALAYFIRRVLTDVYAH